MKSPRFRSQLTAEQSKQCFLKSEQQAANDHRHSFCSAQSWNSQPNNKKEGVQARKEEAEICLSIRQPYVQPPHTS